MYYYKRNIGDYHKKAGRLSMMEHGAYTLLIDSCYDREKFPSEDEAIEWCWARTDEEIAAVKFVLGRFFTLEDGIYIQNRIAEEVDKYHKNALTNKRIAREREEKRKTKKKEASTNRERTVNEPPPNQEPRTKNQEPITINHKPIKKGGKPQFSPPSLQEVDEYITQQGYTVNAEAFFFHYEGNGWMVGKNKMKNWHMALGSWNAREKNQTKNGSGFSTLMELAR